MEHSRTRTIVVDGAIAGLLGALVVALWFLIFDAVRGHPLQTPALLAATLVHGLGSLAGAPPIPQLAAEYTALHVLAFVVVGVAGALLVKAAEREPAFTFSLVIFFGAFEVFFLAVAMLLGPTVIAAMTWWAILVANLLAAATMLAYFLGRHPALAHALFGEWIRVAREGAVAGLIGAVVVALWFLGYDLALKLPFRTPSLLGAEIFTGVKDPNLVKVTLPLVLGYTVLHFLAFVVFGVAAAVLIMAAEWEPLAALAVFVLFAIFEVFFVGFATLLDVALLDTLGWWKIVLGNILALTAMAAYFMHRHRELHTRLVERWTTLDLEGEGLDRVSKPARPAEHGLPGSDR
jgi:hypothetical protein